MQKAFSKLSLGRSFLSNSKIGRRQKDRDNTGKEDFQKENIQQEYNTNQYTESIGSQDYMYPTDVFSKEIMKGDIAVIAGSNPTKSELSTKDASQSILENGTVLDHTRSSFSDNNNQSDNHFDGINQSMAENNICIDYPIEYCEDGKVCVKTGPPPCLQSPLTMDALPNTNFTDKQIEALKTLRQLIDILPISKLSAQEAQRIQGEELQSRSGSGWFSGFLNRTNTPEYTGPVENLLWDEVLWLQDDGILWRYLRSYDWNVETTKKYLFQTLLWRRFRQPHRIHPNEVKSAAIKGNIYRKGFDTKGRPIIYFRPGVEAATSTKAAQLHSVYTMERAMQSLNKLQGCEQLVFLMDFSTWGISQVPTMDLSKEVVNILSDHYTDTLAVCYIVDAPGYFDACWSVIKLMLHENTSKKVRFIHTNKPKDLNLLKSEIPEIYLEDYLGGKSKVSYEHETYWASEVEQYEKFVDFQNAQILQLQSDTQLIKRLISS